MLQLSELSSIPLEDLEFAKVMISLSYMVPYFLYNGFTDKHSRYRAEEHFLVTYQCWKSIRIWTGTPRCRPLMCGLFTSVMMELWSSTGNELVQTSLLTFVSVFMK